MPNKLIRNQLTFSPLLRARVPTVWVVSSTLHSVSSREVQSTPPIKVHNCNIITIFPKPHFSQRKVLYSLSLINVPHLGQVVDEYAGLTLITFKQCFCACHSIHFCILLYCIEYSFSLWFFLKPTTWLIILVSFSKTITLAFNAMTISTIHLPTFLEKSIRIFLSPKEVGNPS